MAAGNGGQEISQYSWFTVYENTAREQGYRYLILESGAPLVAAMALYRKIGYKVIPNYGQYKDMSDSICMKKEL